MLTFWCLATSTLGQAFLGLLGPGIVVWLWQIMKSTAFDARGGPQTDIALSKWYLKVAKVFSWILLVFWLASAALYFGSYDSLSGKGCDAKLTGSASCWVSAFLWSLLPLLLLIIVVALSYVKYQDHDDKAKTALRG